MKRILNIIIITTLAIFISSCTKNYDSTSSYEATYSNNPTGDYEYSGTSKYSASNNNNNITELISTGRMSVSLNNSIHISITPNIGHSYSIEASNLESHNDTTTFRIPIQQINLENQRFNLSGTNSISVGNLGNYDGYFISGKKIVFGYTSTNIDNYDKAETELEGTYRN